MASEADPFIVVTLIQAEIVACVFPFILAPVGIVILALLPLKPYALLLWLLRSATGVAPFTVPLLLYQEESNAVPAAASSKLQIPTASLPNTWAICDAKLSAFAILALSLEGPKATSTM